MNMLTKFQQQGSRSADASALLLPVACLSIFYVRRRYYYRRRGRRPCMSPREPCHARIVDAMEDVYLNSLKTDFIGSTVDPP